MVHIIFGPSWAHILVNVFEFLKCGWVVKWSMSALQMKPTLYFVYHIALQLERCRRPID